MKLLLLTCISQFMQRAAASASPVTPDESSPKRQKHSSPASPATPSSDLQSVPAPQEVLDRQAAEAGETRWALSFLEDGSVTGSHKGLRVVGTSFAGLDDPKAGGLENEEQDGQAWRSNSIVGRKSFGNFKPTMKVISIVRFRILIHVFAQGSRPRIIVGPTDVEEPIRM
jgi:hypothetical protein